jgi:hypothetical protein
MKEVKKPTVVIVSEPAKKEFSGIRSHGSIKVTWLLVTVARMLPYSVSGLKQTKST